jgi:Zn-dependent protease with chaperone function
MINRTAFPSISSTTWEHPADRAALASFARIPGAADIVRRVVGSTTERSLRLAFLGEAARVTDAQFPSVHRLVREAARVLDLSPLPEVFIRLGADPGAFTYGVDRPFIMLTSAALDFWSDDELLGVIGHEMGHILSGHAVYKTLLGLVLKAQSALSEGLLGAAAVAAVTGALREWDRKSELSADRAGLLAVQDSQAVYRALMKTAGGPRVAEMDINEFFRQAHEYAASAEGLDSVLKFLDLIGESHPFTSLRLVSLQEWERGGGYEKVLHGDYPRRDAEGAGGPDDDLRRARESYAKEFSESQDPLSQAAGKVMETLESLFGGARENHGDEDRASDGPAGGPAGPKSVQELFDDIFGKRH